MSRRPRVLVIAYDFPPDAVIGTMRTLRVVRRLADDGWDVTVLTSDPRTYRPGTPVDDVLLSRVPAGVRVVRAQVFRGFDRLKGLVKRRRSKPRATTATTVSATAAATPKPSALPGRLQRAIDIVDAALGIPDAESGWLIPAVLRGYLAVRHERPDVIYSTAPAWTGQLVASALVRLLHCPWVADFRDPWSRAPWRGDRSRFAIRAAKLMERAVVSRADQILFVAAGNRDDFAAHYGAVVARKFRVVPNGCDVEEFERLERPRVDPRGPFVLLHAGSLYAGRTPMPLLKAIAAGVAQGVLDPGRFRLRFLGTAALQDDLSLACRDLGIDGLVEFTPRVPREQSLRAMMAASALLLLQPGHTVSVPGKVYEYLATGRPILAVAEEGETAEIVRESGVGVSVPPADERAILTALERVMQLADGQTAPPKRELFDGAARAVQTVEILAAAAALGDSENVVAAKPTHSVTVEK